MRLYPLIVERQIKGCVNAASDEVTSSGSHRRLRRFPISNCSVGLRTGTIGAHRVPVQSIKHACVTPRRMANGRQPRVIRWPSRIDPRLRRQHHRSLRQRHRRQRLRTSRHVPLLPVSEGHQVDSRRDDDYAGYYDLKTGWKLRVGETLMADG